MKAEQLETLRGRVNAQPLGLALTITISEIRKYLTVVHGSVNILRREEQKQGELLEYTAQYLEDLQTVVDELLVNIICSRVDSMEN